MDIAGSIRDEFLRAAYRLAMVGFSIDDAKLLLVVQYEMEFAQRRTVNINKPPDGEEEAYESHKGWHPRNVRHLWENETTARAKRPDDVQLLQQRLQVVPRRPEAGMPLAGRDGRGLWVSVLQRGDSSDRPMRINDDRQSADDRDDLAREQRRERREREEYLEDERDSYGTTED